MAEYIPPIQRLIEEFRKLPGVGAKTAARYAFAALNFTEEEATRFSDALLGLKRDVHKCPICFGLSTSPESVIYVQTRIETLQSYALLKTQKT